MKKSKSIGKLSLALSRLQGEVTDAVKDIDGYGYKYANLAGILGIARPLLLKHELSIVQLCKSDPQNPSVVGVETVLAHSSDQYISSTMYMPVEPKKNLSAAQNAGVVITYCRRYSFAAILGISQVDTDASNVETRAPKESAPSTKVHKLDESKE